MAFQRIRIKNTNVSGKIPGADKLDTAELCINLKDQKLYSKDADGNVFELGGKVDSGITPPPGPGGNNIGDLFWDGDFLLVWNGNEWVPVGAADLDYTPAPDKGTITNTAGDDVDLPLVDDTNAGLMSPDEHKKLDGMPVIISGDQFPGTPELGDIWIDTNLCPPSINIWNDCEDPGNPDWTPIGGGDPTGCQQGGVAIAGDTEIGSTLTATGGRGLDAGELLPEPTYNWTGPNGFTATGTEIVATEEGNYTVTATVTCIDGTNLETSATKTISDSYVDMVNNTPPVIAVVGELPDGAYSGNNLYVVTPATVINGDNPVIVENQWYRDGAKVSTEQLYTISAADPEGSVLTCRQLFRDARTNEILSDASNGITIVARPADAITFTPVITDDGTDQGNTVGHVLTASALNIQGGTAAIEYEFEWLVGGLNMGTNKTLNLVDSFVGKVVVCNITVAEPDGSNPETRPATYDKIIEVAGTINTPTVLAPLNGDDYSQIETRNLISDSITKIEGGGMHPCSTELIENVGFTDYTSTISITPGSTADSPLGTIFDASQEAAQRIRPNNSWYEFSGFGQVASSVSITTARNMDVSINEVVVGQITDNTASNTTSKEYTFNFTKQAVNTIRLTNTDSGQAFQFKLPKLDEKRLVDNNTILTFSENTGFDCFAQGDVVQSMFVNYSQHLSEDPIDKNYSKDRAFDGLDTTYYRPSTASFVLNYEFTDVTSLKVRCRQAGFSNSNTITVKGNGITTKNITGSALSQLTTVSLTSGTVSGLTFTSSNSSALGVGLSQIEVNGVVLQDTNADVKIISKTDEEPWEIVVDGGDWLGTDGSGTAGGDTELVKEIPYDTKLTVSGDKDLEDMVAGDPMVMSDGTPPGGAYTRKEYKLVTTDIESVVDNTAKTYEFAQDARALDINDLPKWSEVVPTTYNIGENPTGDAGFGLYKAPIGVVWGLNNAVYNNTTKNISIFYSDDGEDWTQDQAPDGDSLWSQVELNVALAGGYTTTHEYLLVHSPGAFSFSFWSIQAALVRITLTFPGDVSTNPDLQYFKAGDVVQGSEFAQVGDPYQHKVHNNDTLGGYPNTYLSDTRQTIGTAPASTPIGTVVTGVFDKPVYGFFEWLEPFNPDLPNAGGTVSYQMLAYWSGSSWILNAKFYGSLNTEPNNVLEGTVAAEVWASIRTDQVTFNTYSIGDTLPFNTSVSDPYNTAKFGFDANAGAIVKVISNGYDLDPKQNTLTVDGGTWAGTDGSNTEEDFEWNTSQQWSANVVNEDAAYPAKNVFDGDDSNYYFKDDSSQQSRVAFTDPVPFTKVEVLGAANTSTGNVCNRYRLWRCWRSI